MAEHTKNPGHDTSAKPWPRWFISRRKTVLAACSLWLVAVIGLVDYLTGYELDFFAFYLIPVTLSVWFVGRGLGAAVSILCVGVSLAGDYFAGARYSSSLVPVWNALIGLAAYSTVVWILSRLRTLHQELEFRVRRRTIALTNEMQERTRLEVELLQISEREQRRIGHDLHDSLCQHFTGAALAGQVLSEKLQAKSLPEAAAAGHLVDLVEEGIELTRKLARGLHLVELEGDGFSHAFQELAAGIEERFKVSCVFESDRPVVMRDAATAVHLYRITQESISNAIRHGKAAHIVIRLDSRDNVVTLTISDDGVGFPEQGRNGKGMGLRIMACRAGMVGAAFNIERRAAGGTRVTCTLPSQETMPIQTDARQTQDPAG
jgi:signal transduction histidine kinase